ncbi:DUF6549 family protein [Chitinophaga niabensis]|uniref:DUF6549 family protein n=1 Tax=Chitinophaga niabensis TaxID=536979 RepID=UPI0031B9F76D
MNTIYRFIIVALLVVIGILATRSCHRKEKVITSIETIQDIRDDSVRFWQDLAGREHAEKQVAEGSISALKIYYKSEIDSLKRIFRMKENALQSFVSAQTETKGSVVLKVDTVYGDTSKTYQFHYDDRWISLQGEIAKEPFIRYSVRDSITFVTYSKKKGLFTKETYVDGFSQNPNTRITGLTGIRVNNAKSKRFGVGPYAGYGFNGTRWTPSAGIAIQYSLINF